MSKHRSHKKTVNPGKYWILVLPVIVIIAIAGAVGYVMANRAGSQISRAEAQTESETVSESVTATPSEEIAADIESAQDDETDWDTVEYNGQTWRKNENVTTLLFMGVDKKASRDNGAALLIGGNGYADTDLLIVMDDSAKTLRVLEISRETMIDVDAYDEDRNLLWTEEGELCTQYSYGDSAARSCQIMKDKVSNLLYGTEIDYTASLTIDGMDAIVDAMGSITLTLEDDWTDVDPSYTAGTTVTMDSTAVDRFVRYRDTEELGSNNTRMSRQAWFIRQMFAQMKAQGSDSYSDYIDAAGDAFYSDMNIDTISKLSEYEMVEPILIVPGEVVAGTHDQFYVDEEGLQAQLIELLYVPVTE